MRAGTLQREEALGVSHPAVTAAHRTGLRLGAGLGAGAGAGLAGHRGWNADLRILASECLLQRDLHIVTQIGATLATAATTAAGRHAENAFKQIGKRSAEIGAEAGRPTAHAVLKCGMTKTVISGALVRILEDLIGLVDFLKAMLGCLVAGMAIRMALHRLLAKCSFYVAVAGSAVNLQGLVIAPLGHQSSPDRCPAIDERAPPFGLRGCYFRQLRWHLTPSLPLSRLFVLFI